MTTAVRVLVARAAVGALTAGLLTAAGTLPAAATTSPSTAPSTAIETAEPAGPTGAPSRAERRTAPLQQRTAVPVRRTTSGAARISTGDEVAVDLGTDVLFAVDSAVLTPEAGAALDAAAGALSTAAPGPLAVTGHADSTGTDAHNLQLSQQRAQAVRDALAPRLGAGWTFTVSGVGEADPLVPETAAADLPEAEAEAQVAAARQLNRRVSVRPA